MLGPYLLNPNMTPEEFSRIKTKDKTYLDAAYNLNEICKAANLYFQIFYPNDQRLGVRRIRQLYLFLFDAIMHSIDLGARVTLTNFGTFKRSKLYPGRMVIPTIGKVPTYRAPNYQVFFKASKHFRTMISKPKDHEIPFTEKSNFVKLMEGKLTEDDIELEQPSDFSET